MKLLQAIPKRWLPWLIAGVFALVALCVVPGLMKHETVVQIRFPMLAPPCPMVFISTSN